MSDFHTINACFFPGSYATNVFEDVGHSTDARELMKDFYVGDLAEVSKLPYGIEWPGSRISQYLVDF